MNGLLEAAEAVRGVATDAARGASPAPERFVILRKKPLLLESVSTELKLSEDDDDFEIGKGLRKHLKVDDHVLVATDRDGDRVVVSTSSGGGGGAEAGEAEAEEEEKQEKEAVEQVVEEMGGGGDVKALEAQLKALTDELKISGVGYIIGPGPRDPDFPYGHAIYVSVEEPVDMNELDQWIKPE